MNTIPFNKEQALAGRLVIPAKHVSARYYNSTIRAKVLAVVKDQAWVAGWSQDIWHVGNLQHDADDGWADPTALAPGHNPAGLTNAQVETSAGFRLLTSEEVEERNKYDIDQGPQPAFSKDIHRWSTDHWDKTGWTGGSRHYTYRTEKPPGFFLPKPKVKRTVPLTPDDMPDRPVYVHQDDGLAYLWTSDWDVNDISTMIQENRQWSLSWRGPWKPFTKEVEVQE